MDSFAQCACKRSQQQRNLDAISLPCALPWFHSSHMRLFIFPTCLQAIAATTLRNNVAGFFSFVCLCVRSCEASGTSRGLGSVQRRLEILHLLQVNHPAQDNKLSRSTGVANAPANLQKVRRPEGRRLHLQWQIGGPKCGCHTNQMAPRC